MSFVALLRHSRSMSFVALLRHSRSMSFMIVSSFARLYYSYKYFFAVSQPSRNEHDGAIFAGTMGLIRRVALATGGGQLFRKLTVFLVSAVPVMVLLGLVRAIALLRRGTGASWRDAIGAFFIWQSTSLVVARASVLGLFAKKAVVLRTPKTSEPTATPTGSPTVP